MKNYSGSSTPNNYQYTGQQYDDEIDLYSLRARYYNPANGRFLSKDTWPINLQNPIELNRYVYTANNPVNFRDPSGYLADLAVYYGQKALTAIGILGQQYLPGIVYQSLAPFLGGALDAIIGYLLGLSAYNLERGNNLSDGFNIPDLIEAIIQGTTLAIANDFIISEVKQNIKDIFTQTFAGWAGLLVTGMLAFALFWKISKIFEEYGYSTHDPKDWQWKSFVQFSVLNWASLSQLVSNQDFGVIINVAGTVWNYLRENKG